MSDKMDTFLKVIGETTTVLVFAIIFAVFIAWCTAPTPIETRTATIQFFDSQPEVDIEGVSSHTNRYGGIRLYGHDGKVIYHTRSYLNVRYHTLIIDGVPVDPVD